MVLTFRLFELLGLFDLNVSEYNKPTQQTCDHAIIPGKNSAVFGRDDLLDEAYRLSFLDPETRNRYVVVG